MRIECPACAATYEVPDDMLAVGQRVACARCGNDWTPLAAPAPITAAPITAARITAAGGPAPPLSAEPARPATLPPDPPPPQPTPPRPPSATDAAGSPPRGEPRPDWFPRADADWSLSDDRSPLVPIAWIGSVATLLVLLGIGIAARDSLMAQWPPASRLFSAIGLDDR